MAKEYDVAVIGAGAAGMMCAAVAAQRGKSVVLVDHASKLAEKIRISGGGRCNFTNRDATPAQFLSANLPFCRSALARCTPHDFIALVQRHRIAFHEKHNGQLFCDGSSDEIISMLLRQDYDRLLSIEIRDIADAAFPMEPEVRKLKYLLESML